MSPGNEREQRTKLARMGTEGPGCRSVALEQLKSRKQVEGIGMIKRKGKWVPFDGPCRGMPPRKHKQQRQCDGFVRPWGRGRVKDWKAILEWGHKRGRQAGRQTERLEGKGRQERKGEAREKRHERELFSGGSFKGCTPRTGNKRVMAELFRRQRQAAAMAEAIRGHK